MTPCGWFDIDSFPDSGPPTSEHCTSGKPALFLNCGFSDDIRVCEDHKCQHNGPAWEHRRALASARHRAETARLAAGSMLLDLMRSGVTSIAFDNPYVAVQMVEVKNAEAALAALETTKDGT